MVFDLEENAERLRQRGLYESGKPSGQTLMKNDDLRVVLIALREGGRIEKHTTSGPVSIQVVEGSIRVVLTGYEVGMKRNHLLTIDAGVPHDVEAEVDALVLVTIGSTRYTVPEGNVHPEE
jgi:quercetin dioxygenase-like cupin family protein